MTSIDKFNNNHFFIYYLRIFICFCVIFCLLHHSIIYAQITKDNSYLTFSNDYELSINKYVSFFGYSNESAVEMIKISHTWHLQDKYRFLFDAKIKYNNKSMSLSEYVEIEKDTIKYLYNIISNHFDGDDSGPYGLLNNVLRDKKAHCFGFTQLFFIYGNSLGLKVIPIEIIEGEGLSFDQLMHNHIEHMACYVKLKNNHIIFVDVAWSYISDETDIDHVYSKKDENYVLKSNYRGKYKYIKYKCINAKGLKAAILSYHGILYLLTKDYKTAIIYFSKCLDVDDVNLGALECRGIAYYENSQITESILDLNKLIKIDKNNCIAYYIRGMDYMALKKYNNAINDFTNAINIDSDCDVAYTERGWCYNEINQYENAIKDYNKSIKINPSYDKSYIYKGATLLYMKKNDDAENEFITAIKINPLAKEKIKIIKKNIRGGSEKGGSEKASGPKTMSSGVGPLGPKTLSNRK
jgi:tetratricopeptide (TPR) repeat protein